MHMEVSVYSRWGAIMFFRRLNWADKFIIAL